LSTQERLIIEAMFKIVDKQGRDSDFLLNSAQALVDTRLTGRDIIPKARQEGVSSYFLARNLAKCISRRNERCVVISHDTESTQRMLGKVHYMVDNMKGAKPVTGSSSRNEISFPKTGGHIYIGTAGSRKFGRGDTITSLHCSEVGYWEDPAELLAGLFQAVPPTTGEISLESTGNGKGNWYHRACMRAYKGESQYRLHFLDWQSFPEYDLPLTPQQATKILENLNADLEEDKLVRDFNLTAGQIHFRRLKLEELDYDMAKFKQEYPMTLDECFQSTGHGIFIKYNYKPTKDWVRIDSHMWGLKDVCMNPTGRYIMGVDVSAGVGKDDSVIDIYDIMTMEQVAQWVSDRIDPVTLADHVVRLGKFFRTAFIVPETNNHGIVTVKGIKDKYPNSHIYRSKLDSENITKIGYHTNAKTKPILVNEFRSSVVSDITIHSPYTVDQMTTFIETETGQLEAQEGCKDDAVIAAALANIGRVRGILALGGPVPISIAQQFRTETDPFSLDGAIENIQKNHDATMYNFPIREQV